MEVLKIIRDADIGSDFPAPASYRERRASRAIVFDRDGKIALLDATKKNYHKLPGGGIDEGEDIKTALDRELQEEIGCTVKNLRELGTIEEYRNGNLRLHQLSYCFLADLDGEVGVPHLEDGEAADGFEIVWMNLEDAIKTSRMRQILRDTRESLYACAISLFYRKLLNSKHEVYKR